MMDDDMTRFVHMYDGHTINVWDSTCPHRATTSICTRPKKEGEGGRERERERCLGQTSSTQSKSVCSFLR